MEDILISKDKKGGTAILTTGSPQSHYGIPVLRIEAEDVDGDFGPADQIGNPPNVMTAAGIVAGWARTGKHTKEEIEAARLFLSQWPDGPQI